MPSLYNVLNEGNEHGKGHQAYAAHKVKATKGKGIVGIRKIFLASFFSGLLTFLTTLLIINHSLYSHREVVMLYVFLAVVGCLSAIFHSQRGEDIDTPKSEALGPPVSVYELPVGVSCLGAVLVGTLCGLFCYDSYGFFSFIYQNSRTYQNTVPSQPAAAVADAGRLVFSSESFIDQTKSAGYAAPNGIRYCVAPIRDTAPGGRVEFWAAGYDCCGWQGSFMCDAAAVPEARGGIVVFDSPGILPQESNRDYYDLARRKAEAYFDLAGTENPVYVRWVENDQLDMLSKFYWRRCAIFITLATLVWGFVTLPIVLLRSNMHFKTFYGFE